MKRIWAVLALVLCLVPALAAAQIRINGVPAEANADGVIVIDADGATITGSAKGLRLAATSAVKRLTFENVQVTAQDGDYAALSLEASDVTLTFVGRDSAFVGGKNPSTALGSSGGDGIAAAGRLTIRGSATARGGEGMDGGDGIKASVLVLEGAVAAQGGYGGGEEGGEGIESENEMIVAPSAVVTVIGGAGKAESGHGVESKLVTIADGAFLSVASGGDDMPAIDGGFSGAGYESDDGVNWTMTTESTKRYFISCPPAQMPKTGDPSMLGAWVALLGAAGAGLKLRRR